MNILVKVYKTPDSKRYFIYDYVTLTELQQLILENYKVVITNVDIEDSLEDDLA